MDRETFPVVGPLFAVGPDNPFFDALLVGGPGVVIAFAVLGRNFFTVGLAVGYLLFFVAGIAYAAVGQRRTEEVPRNKRT